MANFYTDNRDLVFTLKNLDLEEAVTMKEENFRFAKEFENAPVDYADACDNYDRVLKVVGEICAERIAPRSRQVDEEGPHFENGVVTYHPLTVQNLKDLTQADVMGVVLPHRYGGLNFPATIYTAITEMVSRADASLQNLVGLQDIAETICEFGSEEQRIRQERLDSTIDKLRSRFGNNIVRRAITLGDTMSELDPKRDNVIHPVGYF